MWFLSGFLFWSIHIYWIVLSISHISFILGILTLFLLSILFSLFFGLFGLLRELVHSSIGIYGISDGILWVSIEFLRMKIFPWAPAGSAFLKIPVLLQIADISGVYGCSFLFLSISGLFCDIYDFFKRALPSKKFFFSLSFSSALLFISILYGLWRMKGVEEVSSEKEGIRLILLRTDFEQVEKWKDIRGSMERVFYMTEEAMDEKGGIDLMIWPETTIPVPYEFLHFYPNTFIRDWIRSYMRRYHVPLLAGGPLMTKGFSFVNPEFYNSAYLFDDEGNMRYIQAKHILVPFGEYIPLRKEIERFKFMRKWILSKEIFRGDFRSGEKDDIFEISGGRFFVGICWEAIFPDYIRKGIKKGADFLVIISNDGWFSGSWGIRQHFWYGVLRAVENRRYLVRSVNKGIAGIVSPSGRVLMEIDKEGWIEGEIFPMNLSTFYMRYGDIFSSLIILSLSLALIKNIKKLRRV
jgi:apolipoprotein N-acyltransferase